MMNKLIESILNESFHKQFADDLKERLGHEHDFMKLYNSLQEMPWKDIKIIADYLMSGGHSKNKKWTLQSILERHKAAENVREKQKVQKGYSAA